MENTIYPEKERSAGGPGEGEPSLSGSPGRPFLLYRGRSRSPFGGTKGECGVETVGSQNCHALAGRIRCNPSVSLSADSSLSTREPLDHAASYSHYRTARFSLPMTGSSARATCPISAPRCQASRCLVCTRYKITFWLPGLRSSASITRRKRSSC